MKFKGKTIMFDCGNFFFFFFITLKPRVE